MILAVILSIVYINKSLDWSMLEFFSSSELKEYNKIFEDKQYTNIFQLFFYTLAIEKEKKYNLPVENGIISFRNLSNGPLKTKFIDKSTLVNAEKLENYKKGLERLITEILDKNTSFKEK